VDAEHRSEGPGGLESVLEFLDACALPAAAWEPDILALRVREYSPDWLDRLCFIGRAGWGRLSPPQHPKTRAFGPLRSSPVSVFARENLHHWLALCPAPTAAELVPDTNLVLATLARSGAMFFPEIVRATHLLPSRVEQALGELAALGWVTADSFEGLRALLTPAEKRLPFADVARPRRHKAVTSVELAGRWTLLRQQGSVSNAPQPDVDSRFRDEAIERFARVLLRRYGVMFRRLLEREELTVSWFELCRVYRRLEARGEIRGGHFVNGVSGEQYALPEAIGLLRALRKRAANGELITLSAADPLNLVGILTPGARLPAISANRFVMRDGVPIAALIAGEIVELDSGAASEKRAVEQALRIGSLPAALRPYYA
jgi:ATP-dependent Lhr-like helicase